MSHVRVASCWALGIGMFVAWGEYQHASLHPLLLYLLYRSPLKRSLKKDHSANWPMVHDVTISKTENQVYRWVFDVRPLGKSCPCSDARTWQYQIFKHIWWYHDPVLFSSQHPRIQGAEKPEVPSPTIIALWTKWLHIECRIQSKSRFLKVGAMEGMVDLDSFGLFSLGPMAGGSKHFDGRKKVAHDHWEIMSPVKIPHLPSRL